MRVERIAAPLREQAFEVLRQAIIAGRFAPGQRLVERELIEQLGVSRTTIREVLRELDVRGLVTSIPNKGTIVVALTPGVADELQDVQKALEGTAARRFAAEATDADIDALHRALARLEQVVSDHGGVDEILVAKDAFFATFLDAAGNAQIRPILRGIQDRVAILRVASLSRAGRPREVVEELRHILNAASARDAEALAAACAAHIDREFADGLAALES